MALESEVGSRPGERVVDQAHRKDSRGAPRHLRPAATPARTRTPTSSRRFAVEGPNRLWVTEITEHPTGGGKLYCAAVLDAYSRRIVGRSIDDNMRSVLVTDAPRERLHDPAFRSRVATHVVGVRATRARRWPARLDGLGRRSRRQLNDGIVLGHHATRTRVLVRSRAPPFQHQNAQSDQLRSSPHTT